MLDTSGNFIHEVGSQGSGLCEFDQPTGVAVDDAMQVYIADSVNDWVQKYW